MRHGKSGKKLGRTSSHRIAMLRNMVTSFLKYEKVKTTDVKAKELKKVAEKMVTLGKRGDLHARRQAVAFIREKDVVAKLFEVTQESSKWVIASGTMLPCLSSNSYGRQLRNSLKQRLSRVNRKNHFNRQCFQ
jgi:ribosomal protein L17